jgi:TolB-like protein/Tfp pilus assembly protein PilF
MASTTGLAPASAEIQEEVGRVLASSAFARPRRLARLLKYMVEHKLRGEEEHLKETVLGIEVFDRGQDFDPRTDPIVRIDARRLRARLSQYYADEGVANPVVIILEPGSYIPSFRRRGDAEFRGSPIQSQKRASVAVLPFLNLSDQPEFELFCEGISEDILNRLAQQEGLRVIARTSAFQFRDPTRDPRHIARQLRVQTLVTGSLRSDQGEVRITAQLVNAEESTILWSQEYEHASDSMLETQEAISREIAARFLGLNDKQWSAKKSENKEAQPEAAAPAHSCGNSAYRLFLQGRRLFHQGDNEGYLQGMKSLEAAVKLDPAYAAAWGTLALACVSLLALRTRPPQPLIARTRSAAQKALELDGLSLDAHTALGMLAALADFNWTEARQWFERALKINPLYPTARLAWAMLWCAPNLQLDEAEDALEGVLSTDPLNAEAMLNLGRIFYHQRRFDLAAEMMQAILDNNVKHGNAWIMLALVREQMGRKQDALESYHCWSNLVSASFAKTWVKAIDQIMNGDRESAERTARKLAWTAKLTTFPLAGLIADLYIRLENYDTAMDWLEKAYKERAIRLICAAVDPAFDSIRRHPRFIRLVKSIMGNAGSNPAAQNEVSGTTVVRD